MAQEKSSFTKEVKNELSNLEYSKEELKWILSGFARNGSDFSIGKHPSLVLKTDIAQVAKVLFNALKECYGLNPKIVYEKVAKFGKGLVYLVSVEDARLYDVMEDLEILEGGFYHIPPKEGLHRRYLKPMVIGSFLSAGSLNNPSLERTFYFLEIAFSHKQDALAIKKKIDSFKGEKTIQFKYIKRREKHVLYLKKSDQISVFLSYIGAFDAMFKFENYRVMKEDININNRLTICDQANYSKTLSTAQKDIQMIDELLSYKPASSFDVKVQAVMQVRREYPDFNYREIADHMTNRMGISISKSGIAHIMLSLRKKLEEIKPKE